MLADLCQISQMPQLLQWVEEYSCAAAVHAMHATCLLCKEWWVNALVRADISDVHG